VALIALPLAPVGVLGRSTTSTVVATVIWGVAFGALPTLTQTAARRAAPDAEDAAPGLTNATTDVGTAGGGVIGGRELLVDAPAGLSLVVVLARRPARDRP
jgi:predicted MFS family arabinose efflux permease